MDDTYYLGGLVALASAGVTLYRLRQRLKRATPTTRYFPHVNASGDFMCFSCGKPSPADLGDEAQK
ncbi:MAG: hypothetical protein RL042_2159 [Nitrospirota bacterium]|jgi:hypothetical protein